MDRMISTLEDTNFLSVIYIFLLVQLIPDAETRRLFIAAHLGEKGGHLQAASRHPVYTLLEEYDRSI
jgi:hypothetical protein